MLDLIRNNRNLFSIIFIVSAVGMVITMFASPGARSGLGGIGLSGGVVARVEGEEIQTTELLQVLSRQMEQAQRSINEQLKGANNNPETRKFFEGMIKAQVTPDNILRQLIERKFAETTAEKLGFEAPADVIRDRIQAMDVFQKDGRFDPLLYRQMVAAPADFEREIGSEAKLNAMRSAFVSGLGILSPSESAESAFLGQKRVFEALIVNPREFPEPAKADAAEVTAFLASPDATAKLQAYYDRHLRDFQREEEVHAKHILVKGDDAGLKKIQELLSEIRAGKTTWEAAAKANSEDKSNADKGGDLGFFGRGRMDPAFEQAAFALKGKGDISEPVKSNFGYHLIQLIDRKPAVKRGLDEVKNEIAANVVLESKRLERAQAWLKEWLASGKVPADKDLKKFGLSWAKLPAWSPLDESLGQLGSIDTRLPEILALGANKPLLASPLIQGESLVALRWIETKADEKAQNVNAQTSEKVMDAFQFYLSKRFEKLVKNNKIVRSEKTLATLRSQMDRSQGG